MAFQTRLTTSERFSSLFQPDTVMPTQYMETFRRLTHLEPEKRLMLAVLEDGVACFQKYATARDGRGKKIFLETESWLTEEPSERLYSFANVCESLGLNADYLRQGLMRWKAAHLKERFIGRVFKLAPTVEEKADTSTKTATIARPLRQVAS
ncbi:MAG: hypothetical protein OEN50_14630 [Deltaproteobacteria bacterium]|nr:hypothetical protein [Deltaproteobacteria bacterium]